MNSGAPPSPPLPPPPPPPAPESGGLAVNSPQTVCKVPSPTMRKSIHEGVKGGFKGHNNNQSNNNNDRSSSSSNASKPHHHHNHHNHHHHHHHKPAANRQISHSHESSNNSNGPKLDDYQSTAVTSRTNPLFSDPDHRGHDDHDSSNANKDKFCIDRRKNDTYSKAAELGLGKYKSSTCAKPNKPRYAFLSQLYLILHVALTICLLRNLGVHGHNKDISESLGITYRDIIYYYLAYLMGTSFLFLVLLRCCASDIYDSPDSKDFIKSEYASVLLGSMCLGLIQLIAIGLDVAQCIENELVFLPVLHFIFVFFIMHFILSQVTQGNRQEFNNMALAHLLATQISLWLINFETTLSPCGYNKLNNDDQPHGSSTQRISKRIYTSGSQNGAANQTSLGRGTTIAPEMSVEKQSIIPSNVTDLLTPIIHHYQILIASIVLTMMLTNNQMGKYQQKLVHKQARLMDGETIRSFLTSKTRAVKGFFVGLLVLAAGFIVLVLGDEMLTICTHTGIQGVACIAAIIGLLIRGRGSSSTALSGYAGYKYYTGPYVWTYDFLNYITVFAAYYYGLSLVLNNSLSSNINPIIILNGVVLIFQISFQTFLIRSRERTSTAIKNIFAFLILSNMSLWILEVNEAASFLASRGGVTNLVSLVPLLVALNRFYSALIFIQYWRNK